MTTYLTGMAQVTEPDALMEQIKVLETDLNVSALVREMLRVRLEYRTHRCSRCGQELPTDKEST